MPLVSVIICIFNAEKYLHDALNSIEHQSYNNIELIIINDGSTDSSESIIDLFMQSSRLKVVYHKQQNAGLTASLNKAISLSSGEYIARMDADDISSVERIEKSLFFLNGHKLDFICAMAERFNDDGHSLGVVPSSRFQIGSLLSKKVLKYGNPVVHGTFFAKREVFETVKYNENYRTAQDYDFICNMILNHNYRVGYIPEILYSLRVDELSSGRKKGGTQLSNAMSICEIHFGSTSSLIPAAIGIKKNYLSMKKRIDLCVGVIFSSYLNG